MDKFMGCLVEVIIKGLIKENERLTKENEEIRKENAELKQGIRGLAEKVEE